MSDNLSLPSSGELRESLRNEVVHLRARVKELEYDKAMLQAIGWELEAKVAELEALAQWEPVPDYELYGRSGENRYVKVLAHGGVLKALYGLGEKRRTMTVNLPDNVRLFRRKPTEATHD